MFLLWSYAIAPSGEIIIPFEATSRDSVTGLGHWCGTPGPGVPVYLASTYFADSNCKHASTRIYNWTVYNYTYQHQYLHIIRKNSCQSRSPSQLDVHIRFYVTPSAYLNKIRNKRYSGINDNTHPKSSSIDLKKNL